MLQFNFNRYIGLVLISGLLLDMGFIQTIRLREGYSMYRIQDKSQHKYNLNDFNLHMKDTKMV